MKEEWSDNCKYKHTVELNYKRAKKLFKSEYLIIKLYRVFNNYPLYVKVYIENKGILFSNNILLFEIKNKYIKVVNESGYRLALKFAKKYDYDLIKDWC